MIALFLVLLSCSEQAGETIDPNEPGAVQSRPNIHINPLPNYRVLVIKAHTDRININPYKCIPLDSAVCVGLFPELIIPEVFTVDFEKIPVPLPDPCYNCPPFIPLITELVDQNGKTVEINIKDVDPMILTDGFLFLQLNQPEEELMKNSSYGLAHPVKLEDSWAKHLGLKGNIIPSGSYFNYYDKKTNTSTIAIPEDVIR